ncbi:MAG: hypothetical protein U0694_27930 [Anaerolineae bacterium]
MKIIRHWGIGWIIAFLSFPAGGVAAMLLIGRLETPLEGLLGGLAAGAIIGIGQMLALRRRLAIDWRWIVATAVGMAAGLTLNLALFGAETHFNATLTRAPLTGLLLGLAQWLVLRQYVRQALWWLPALTLIYTLAWFITAQVIGASLDEGFVVFGSSGAILYQVLTGLTLWALLRLSQSPQQA